MIRLTLITGPMFSGKTTSLAHALRTHEASGKHITLLRPTADTRTSRTLGGITPVLRVLPNSDRDGHRAARALDTTAVIGIDEVQFIAGWTVKFLQALQEQSTLPEIRVIAAGLDLKADATLWPHMDALAERAELHIRHTATCARCGAPATMTRATRPLPPGGVQIGDADMYQPLCRHCWEKAEAEQQQLQRIKAAHGKAAA